MIQLSLLPPWLEAAWPVLAIFFVTSACLLVLRVVLLRALDQFVRRTLTSVDDFFVRILRYPSMLWCIAVAIYVALSSENVPENVQAWSSLGLSVILIVSVTLVISNLASEAMHAALHRRSNIGTVTTIGDVAVRGIILVIGAMVLLNYLGIEIAPMLTALGVGGLAVALALQDTLGNLFAGIHILLERPFSVGHWIRVEEHEGRVIDIGWRTTRIQTLAEHMVVIPNSRISGSTIQNLYLPSYAVRVVIDVGISYAADPERVISVLRDELRGLVAENEWFVSDFEPDVSVAGFGDSAVNYQVRLKIHDASISRQARDAMLRRVFRRLREESLEIPFPQRVVWMRREEGSESP